VKQNFVVVAHGEQAREALARDLHAHGYSVTRATSGRQAEQIVRSVAVDAVIIESHLPDMPPEELRARIAKLRPGCRVTVVTDFGQLRSTPQELYQEHGGYLLRAAEVLGLVEAPFTAAQAGGGAPSFSERGNDALIDTLDVVVGILELDDRYFGGFSHQAMSLARRIAESLALGVEAVREIAIATLVRDLGKVGVPDEVLSETGRYSPEQRERMKAHVDGALRLFEHVDFPWKVLPIVRHHHERYDGKGHPDGLRGREIPLGSRIVAVVDGFVAMTSGRGHRPASDAEQALEVLIAEAGRQFDPEVVEALQRVLDQRRSTARGQRKPTVVLAATQDEHRRAIKMRLLNDGVEIIEQKNAARALRSVRKDTPELVLCDLDADATAGFELLREMREDPVLAAVPLAFLADHADRILKLRALREGADDFLCKSDDLEVLVARVQNILAREASRRSGHVARMRRGISGDLENLALADIVQMLASGMKTACVSLESRGRRGQIWFENGAARHAHAAGIDGEPAFFEMVRWSDGSFVIEHGVSTKQQSVTQDALFLVMEGMRLLDEDEERSATGASGA
jgi:response regulator RpfG family c-di-GMP phosphodiesterase